MVTELRGIRAAERAQERVERANFVWGQPGMFGAGKVYGELDNLSLAQVLNRMDAMAPADDGRSLSQRRADGLVAMATHHCGEDSNRSAADVNVIVPLDVDNVDVTAAGVIEINAPGCLPTITGQSRRGVGSGRVGAGGAVRRWTPVDGHQEGLGRKAAQGGAHRGQSP